MSPCAHGAEDVHLALRAAALLQRRRSDSLPRRVAQLAEALDRVDVSEIVEPEQPGALVDLNRIDLHRLDQLVAQARLHLRGDLEPDHLAEAPAADLLLHSEKQVVRLIGDVVVRVASDTEHGLVDDLHSREEVVEVGGDHVLEWDEGEAVADREEAAQQLLRHLDPGGNLLVLLRVAEQDTPVEREVRDVREGTASPDHQRRECREDLAGEEVFHLLPLLRIRIIQGDDPDAVLGEGRSDLLGEAAAEAVAELDRPLAIQLDYVGRRHCVGAAGIDLRLHLVVEAGHADHEELVEVVLVDRREVDALEQRDARVLGELQDPVVEVEPGELAVEVEGWIGEVGFGAVRPHPFRRDRGAGVSRRSARLRALLGELVGHAPTLAVGTKPL